MPTLDIASPKLTTADFEAQYGHEKPYYEFWDGEAIQKSMPNSVHGLLQRIVMDFLHESGYKCVSEVKLKIDASFQPVPDIIATRGPVEIPYPTKPVEIVVEILSDDDPMSRLLAKCRMYQRWGFQEICVVDPSARLLFRWSEHRLEEVASLSTTPAASIWTALDHEIQ